MRDMGTPPRPAANVDLFDTYFRRADLDRDGRISGNEAVSFFQASGLPKNVLAQIWTYADQKRIGFLGRAEFYNALKLVTVAQSKRELTPELVKAALFGPTSSKIPAPQINLSAVPAQQPIAGSAPVTSQSGTNVPPVPQTSGVRGPQPLPNANLQSGSSPGNSVVRPSKSSLGGSGLGCGGTGLAGVTDPSSSTRPVLGVGLQPVSQGSTFTGMQVGTGAVARPPRPPGSSAPIQPQAPSRSFRPPNVPGITSQSNTKWPTLTQSDIQKYTRVFVEVDTDRDGKISGIQARDLFLSWRLPREILKQVWDLSDQDNDSMLSLKEFCIALYLMERYREGRPLPHALPNNILVDFSTIIQPMPGYNSGILKPTPGRQHQPGKPGPGAHTRASGPGQPLPDLAPPTNEETQPAQQKSRVPILEKHLVDQLSKEEQDALNSKFCEATESEKKVEELEKEITESRQRIEFYRAKMQELVLYKSRCDNHINEIIERASADKREVELLSKKYEEKYKQMGDVASKLTIEEATFRDIQEKKMDLYKAIVKMEQDGGDVGVNQGHADRIQKEIDELVKSLNERCKKYGLRARPGSLLELPFGWQPGIQEDVADWDDDWDKFEDEGFSFVKDLTLDVKNVIAPPKTKSTSVLKEATTAGSASPSSADTNLSDKSPRKDKETLENGSEHKKNEDDAAESVPNSPAAGATSESPSKKITDPYLDKNESEHASPRFDKPESEHKGGNLSPSRDNKHDEPKWGRFDASDVADSLWGFNGNATTKEIDHGNHIETDAGNKNDDYFFDSGDFNLNPIKTGSSQTEWNLPPKSTFAFDESVPSTPLKSTFAFVESVPSTPLTGGNDYSFDKFSRFDSFNMSDGDLFKPPETPSTIDFGRREFSRFDSFSNTSDFDPGRSRRSSTDFDHGNDFSRFDSMNISSNFDDGRDFYNFDTVSSTGNFDNGKDLSRFDSMRSNNDIGQGAFSRFDSMRSTQDFEPTHGFPSFDNSDPFGTTGPFKSSFASETPRSEYNSWGVSETPRGDSNSWGVSETPRRDSNSWGVSKTPRRDSDSWSVSDPFGPTGPFSSSFDAETPRKTSFDGETPRKTTFDSETPRSTNWSAF